MSIDYLNEFPIPQALLPEQLRTLLEPITSTPRQAVEVTLRYDFDMFGPKREYVHMIMAVIPDDSPSINSLLKESRDGVVSFSVPILDKKGNIREFSPSISGNDYIVASWGNGSFYTFGLAEKVWMSLGLTPRCIGNESQRVIYDDLSLPEFNVAEGEISNEHYWSPKRQIKWTMSNEYLRTYLWMRGAYGVRVFFYEILLQDGPQLRALMQGKNHIAIAPQNGWYEIDIREFKGGLLLQVWATVTAIHPELSPEQSANGIIWPDVPNPMTHARADALVGATLVFLNDKFLERYEQSSFFDATPAVVFGKWGCSPSYRNQWGFTECVRVGRNMIQVPMRELYKPKPDREILHARAYAMSRGEITQFDQQEEHVVSKTQRLLDQLLELGDNLSALAHVFGIQKSAQDLIGISREEIGSNGWLVYPQLARLAQVAPLDMSQQAFLARCKSLHELWQRVPDGFMKLLLAKAGCLRQTTKELGSLKLLQALLNIVERLNANEESVDSFENTEEPAEWSNKNTVMAPLFLNNELRIAHAHEAIAESLKTLELLGFDTANVNQGYGRALDFVMDNVIKAFATINEELEKLLAS